jgi:hypothetical protein
LLRIRRDYFRDEPVAAQYLNLGLLVFGVRMKMDYFQVDWCQNVVRVALAFGASAACQLVVHSQVSVDLLRQ